MKNFLLFLFFLIAISSSAQDCSDLFISEYIEGPANDNAIEIYNPTSSTINLSGYTLNRYSNGANTVSAPYTFSLSGTIDANDAIVIGNGQLDSIDLGTYWSIPVSDNLYQLFDDYCAGDYNANSTFYFNGDDAITLEYNGVIVDIFGKVGEDPGMAWTDDVSSGYTDANGGTWWTKRQTLVRKPNVKMGTSVNPILFNPTLEWDSLPDATYNLLGYHDCDCASTSGLFHNKDVSYVMYPNPIKQGNHIRVNSEIPIKNMKVTNSLGQTSIYDEFINISYLPKGVYIIQFEFMNGVIDENKLVIE